MSRKATTSSLSSISDRGYYPCTSWRRRAFSWHGDICKAAQSSYSRDWGRAGWRKLHAGIPSMDTFWVITGTLQCLDNSLFVFVPKRFHCDCQFHGTVSCPCCLEWRNGLGMTIGHCTIKKSRFSKKTVSLVFCNNLCYMKQFARLIRKQYRNCKDSAALNEPIELSRHCKVPVMTQKVSIQKECSNKGRNHFPALSPGLSGSSTETVKILPR